MFNYFEPISVFCSNQYYASDYGKVTKDKSSNSKNNKRKTQGKTKFSQHNRSVFQKFSVMLHLLVDSA